MRKATRPPMRNWVLLVKEEGLLDAVCELHARAIITAARATPTRTPDEPSLDRRSRHEPQGNARGGEASFILSEGGRTGRPSSQEAGCSLGAAVAAYVSTFQHQRTAQSLAASQKSERVRIELTSSREAGRRRL